ncbi:PASTA domain-containing protein [Liquorilactobacillus sicerae]|uniref:PASTA domain-containing protein n=1 Tax=Liquorilactobacillus sicerae TaxID=1416943 RepID=UPI002480A3BB|nr:PASTA domain-containing protein [Liquorilactobacillus sicerae]
MSKKKIFSKVTKTVLDAVAPDFVDSATKIVGDQLEKRKDYVHIPDVTLISVEEAEKILSQYGFNFSKVLVTPDIKYANKRSFTVIDLSPKVGWAVDPKTYVKIFYANDEIIEKSKSLKLKADQEKKFAKQKHQETLNKLTNETIEQTTKLAKKFNFHKSKNNGPAK